MVGGLSTFLLLCIQPRLKLSNTINHEIDMLGQQETKRIYLSINQGKVASGTGDNKQFFSFVEGCIENIYTKRSTFGNEVVTRWYIDLRDGGDLYSLCLPYSSGVFKSIILSLASYMELTTTTPVKIAPYMGRNGFSKVVVYADGIKLDWVTKQLPQQEVVAVGDKQIKDDTKQMELITSYVSEILKKIRG